MDCREEEITPPDISSCISPVDSRYWDAKPAGIFSARAILKTYLRIELALIKALHKLGKCDQKVLEEVTSACELITPQEVAEQEKITDHVVNHGIAIDTKRKHFILVAM